MQRGLSDCKDVSVCIYVRLSVTRVNCDRTNESSADIFIPYERKINLLFRTQRMVGGGYPLLPEILDQIYPLSFKNGDFQSIFARSGSTLGPSEKSSLSLIGSRHELFNEPKMNSVRCPYPFPPPRRGSKHKLAIFSSKSVLLSKKVC